LAQVARGAVPLLRHLRPDAAAMIAERSVAAAALETWGRSRSDGPLVWLHGASAGELLGASPAIQALRGQTDLQLVVTHFSPSGASALPRLKPDYAGYPPLDTRKDCERVVSAVRPDALVYAKLDVWPGLTGAAARAGVPTGMINAVVRRGSRRMAPVARSALRSAYSTLSFVGAASDEDATRLQRLGVRPEILSVTGDASFDLAVARADRAGEAGGARERFEAQLPSRPPAGVRVVAGSTWPTDEDALLAALAALGERRGRVQLVVAPHQPTESHLDRLRTACRRRDVRMVRWSEVASGARSGVAGTGLEPDTIGGGETQADVVAFDEVGTLAELYTAADIAYVGGAIEGTGLHNVLEPAAAGVPVLFGPRHDRREANELVAVGGGVEAAPDSLATAIGSLLDDTIRGRTGKLAREYVCSRCGAAEAGAELIFRLLDERQ
jgi:3-deoxy-D-manno-octulosonic-acid transferase